jgi:hypothetical protein
MRLNSKVNGKTVPDWMSCYITNYPSQHADKQNPDQYQPQQNPTDWNASLNMDIKRMPMWLEYGSDGMPLRLARMDGMPHGLDTGQRAACPVAPLSSG